MKLQKILISLFLLFSLLVIPQASFAISNLTVHFINVGQGDSALIKTPSGENFLIDGGKKSQGSTVINYLKKQKVKTLNAIIATHPDADHIGGLEQVIRYFNVKSVYAPKVSNNTITYKNFLLAVKKKHLTIKTAKTGVTIPIKDKKTSAKFIAPVRSYSKSDTNNWSGVLLLKHNKKSFLFTGDAEKASENDMLSKRLVPDIDVLKVGHHGSKYSSNTNFLKKARPNYAIISVGKNSYGHPTSDVLKRLNSVHAKIYRTDKSHNIIVTSTGTKLSIRTVK
ncbi:ComEC/Rec2 family competence protein [Terrilactibacillus laevilacticus]|uniref:ComEC/Rec2 family competence protein n=1 Tax=Terrilactibacillus laevilacticus TaxID=1380157 RepID=A0ABW5PNU6_9BACI|nr:ComEC/Rec2 family competence protein [Terrilactibacillus laevilacticus]